MKRKRAKRNRSRSLHPGAYLRMRYECSSCEEVLKIYNYRNGPAPLVIHCPRCGLFTMSHSPDPEVPDAFVGEHYQAEEGSFAFVGDIASVRIAVWSTEE